MAHKLVKKIDIAGRTTATITLTADHGVPEYAVQLTGTGYDGQSVGPYRWTYANYLEALNKAADLAAEYAVHILSITSIKD